MRAAAGGVKEPGVRVEAEKESWSLPPSPCAHTLGCSLQPPPGQGRARVPVAPPFYRQPRPGAQGRLRVCALTSLGAACTSGRPRLFGANLVLHLPTATCPTKACPHPETRERAHRSGEAARERSQGRAGGLPLTGRPSVPSPCAPRSPPALPWRRTLTW